MKRLKPLLAFLALILVSLAPVHAEEGYIPYFPDFLEPDGIGFRGPAKISSRLCWSSFSGCRSHKPGMPYSEGYSHVRSSPITLEYRKNYFFNKLFYYQAVADFGSAYGNEDIRSATEDPTSDNHYTASTIFQDSVMKNFITAEEKSLLSSLDSSRIIDLHTESSFVLLGAGIGIDLWVFEISFAPFLMYYDTTVSLRSCKRVYYSSNTSSSTDISQCSINPDSIIKVSEQIFLVLQLE